MPGGPQTHHLDDNAVGIDTVDQENHWQSDHGTLLVYLPPLCCKLRAHPGTPTTKASTSPIHPTKSLPLNYPGPDGEVKERVRPLAIARYIEDFSLVTYPEGVKPPDAELNINAKGGKFRYLPSSPQRSINDHSMSIDMTANSCSNSERYVRRSRSCPLYSTILA